MAPTSSKGSNPAPNFAMHMNRIQMSLDSHLSAARFLQQHRATAASKAQSAKAPTAGATGAFSSLQSSSSPNSNNTTSSQNTQSYQQDRAARLAAEEAEFAEDRALDPNAGIGFAKPGRAPDVAGTKTARDRDDKMLRGRILGGRNRGDGSSGAAAADKWRRRKDESSEDDEPGRSGLGRAKKKRRRSQDDDDEQTEEAQPSQAEHFIQMAETSLPDETELVETNREGLNSALELEARVAREEAEVSPSTVEKKKKNKKKKRRKTKDLSI